MNRRRWLIAFGILLGMLLVAWFIQPSKNQEAVKSSEGRLNSAEEVVESIPSPAAQKGFEVSAKHGINSVVKKPLKISAKDLEQRRSLVKSALSSAYTSQKAYFAAYQRYSTDLKAVGWQPFEPVIKFKMGFLSPYNPSDYNDETLREEPARMDTDSFINEIGEGGEESYAYDPWVQNIRLADYASYCQRGCTADDKHFEYVIVIPLDDQGNVDVWMVNEQKVITLVVDGTK